MKPFLLFLFIIFTLLIVLNAKRKGGSRDRGFDTHRPGGAGQQDTGDEEEGDGNDEVVENNQVER